MPLDDDRLPRFYYIHAPEGTPSELGLRYSTIDLTDGPVDGGEMDIWSFGVKWKLTPVFVIDANYRYIMLDREGFESDSDGFLIRLLLLLE